MCMEDGISEMQVLNLFELQLPNSFIFLEENTSQFYSFLGNVFLLIYEVLLEYCGKVGPMNI